MEDEENQIRGFVHVVDATGITLPYMTIFTPREAMRIVKNAEVLNDKLEKETHLFTNLKQFYFV